MRRSIPISSDRKLPTSNETTNTGRDFTSAKYRQQPRHRVAEGPRIGQALRIQSGDNISPFVAAIETFLNLSLQSHRNIRALSTGLQDMIGCIRKVTS